MKGTPYSSAPSTLAEYASKAAENAYDEAGISHCETQVHFIAQKQSEGLGNANVLRERTSALVQQLFSPSIENHYNDSLPTPTNVGGKR